MQLSETDKAYLAGMIDGEGCITIICSRGRYYVLQVIITGTNENHIKACAEMAGIGSISHRRSKGVQAAQWRWSISGNDALGMLRSIIPYLILKRGQAQLAVRFQKHMQDSPGYNQHHPVPAAVLAYRQRLMDALKEMKRNGKVFDGEQHEDIEPPEQPFQQLSLLDTV